MNLKSILAVILAGVIMLGAFAGCQQQTGDNPTQQSADAGGAQAPQTQDQPESSGEIVIGVPCGITSDAPMTGERTKRGVNLAVEEINAAGGVLGKQIRVIFEDDKNLPDVCVNAVNKLLSDNVDFLVGPTFSSNVMAISDIIEKNQIPILVGGTSPKIVGLENDYIFRVRASDTIHAYAATKYLVETLGCSKLGLMYNNDDFGTGAKAVIEEYCQANNIELVSEGHNTGDKDMSAALSKLKDAGIDGLISWTHDQEMPLILKQSYQLGMDIPRIGSPSISTSTVLDLLSEEEVEGVYCSTDFVRDDATPAVQDFIALYKQNYDDEPELYIATYYGAVHLLADAIERAGTTEREAVRAALMETDGVQGIVGMYKANEDGEMVHQVSIAQIQGKNPVQVEKVSR